MARDSLSRESASGTPAGLSTGGCPQGGTQAPGLPFSGEAKKVESPAAATERHQDSAAESVRDSETKKFGSGRFRGQSTNFPRLRLALRVLRRKIVIRPQKPVGSLRSEIVI